ncbi:MAG: hypothetical protein MHM6MM_003113 [Cercozoa sp. M6MM]
MYAQPERLLEDREWPPLPKTPRKEVLSVLSGMSQYGIAKTLDKLTSFHSRNSFAPSAREAGRWIAQSLKDSGADKVDLVEFSDKMCPNVVAEFRGVSDEIVVVGAHYDCRNEDVNDIILPAPGADDNGSGTSSLLNLARVFGDLRRRNGFKPEKTVHVQFYCGEEQGLFGSKALAEQYKNEDRNVYAMVNFDMMAWQATPQSTPPYDDPITLGIMDRFVSPSLSAYVQDIVKLYLPGLAVEETPACCSDSYSYHQEGFHSVGLAENRREYTAYPWYHTTEDTIDKINLFQLEMHAKALAAIVSTLAGV